MPRLDKPETEKPPMMSLIVAGGGQEVASREQQPVASGRDSLFASRESLEEYIKKVLETHPLFVRLAAASGTSPVEPPPLTAEELCSEGDAEFFNGFLEKKARKRTKR